MEGNPLIGKRRHIVYNLYEISFVPIRCISELLFILEKKKIQASNQDKILQIDFIRLRKSQTQFKSWRLFKLVAM